MKNLVIPESITLRNDDGEPYQRMKKGAAQPSPEAIQAGASPVTEDETYTFWTWLRQFVLRDEKFNLPGWDTWEQVTRISKLKDAPAGESVAIDDADLKLMLEVAKKPSKPTYSDGLIAAQFVPFIRALIAADEDV